MKNYEAIKYLVKNELAESKLGINDRGDLAFALIDVLTAEFSLSALLDLMEEATDLEAVYEATVDWLIDNPKFEPLEPTEEDEKQWQREREEAHREYERSQ